MCYSDRKTSKRRYQKTSFNSVGACLDYLPPDERELTEFLREVILECIPGCIEKLSFNVPFYRRHYPICFLWPASIEWGGPDREGVRLGFSRGYLISDEMGFLEAGGRKKVYCHDYGRLSEVDPVLLRAYLEQAVELDEAAYLRKK